MLPIFYTQSWKTLELKKKKLYKALHIEQLQILLFLFTKLLFLYYSKSHS